MVHLYMSVSGGHAEREDSYRLITNQDGTYTVEHSWSYMDPSSKALDSGKVQISVANFMIGEFDERAKEALRIFLADKAVGQNN